MLDIKFIRENKDIIQAGAKKKHIDFDVNALIAVDDARRELQQSIERKRARQNEVSVLIVKGGGVATQSELLAEVKALKKSLQTEEEQLKEVMKSWQPLMLQVPNIPDMSVPEGESDKQNVEVRNWGTKPSFSFEPKTHVELMEKLDLADFEKGAEVAGFRGYFLKNDAVLLNLALWQYVLQFFVKKGYKLMQVPSMVRKETLYGTGYLPQGKEDLYVTQDEDYLAGTGEVGAMGYFMGTTLKSEDLPLKILAFSPCFRREAGSHGKDVKGLYRVHEFFKFEQVVLCEASHETSVKIHEELTLNAEEMLQGLELPYHTVVNCGGDLGLGQVKKYDIEVWRAGQQAYGETHSSSYFHDFQTRRLNIRYKDAEGKLRFAHSLNNTALASPRILIPLIENNQEEDGTIRIPKALQPFTLKDRITR